MASLQLLEQGQVGSNAHTALTIRRNVWGLAVRMLALAGVAGLCYMLLGLIAILLPTSAAGAYAVGLAVIFALLNIAMIFYVIRQLTAWLSVDYLVSDNHLVEREGLRHVVERMCNLHDLGTVDIRQSWLGRRLNYGTIILVLSGPGYSRQMELDDVQSPQQYDKLWFEAIMSPSPSH